MRPQPIPEYTVPRSVRPAGGAVLLLSLAACAGPVQIAPAAPEVLADFDALPDPLEAWAGADAPTDPVDVAAAARDRHPGLARLRADVRAARALEAAAGRWDDPEFSWDGMNAYAPLFVNGHAVTVDYLAGFGLVTSPPAPGERQARIDAAEALTRGLEAEIEASERDWLLGVCLAAEALFESEALLAERRRLAESVDAQRAWFERARAGGMATGLELGLATGEFHAAVGEELSLEREVAARGRALNALLWRRPTLDVAIAPLSIEEVEARIAAAVAETEGDAWVAGLPAARSALERWRIAEASLRAELALRFPKLTLGTVLGFTPGLFSRFNAPEIEAARARLDAASADRAAVLVEARMRLEALRQALDAAGRARDHAHGARLESAESNAGLADVALESAQLTLPEALLVRRSVFEARAAVHRAEAERRRAAWRFLHAAGALRLPGAPSEHDADAASEPASPHR